MFLISGPPPSASNTRERSPLPPCDPPPFDAPWSGSEPSLPSDWSDSSEGAVIEEIPFSVPLLPCSGVDTFPVLAHAKMLYQWTAGDPDGAQQTWDNNTTYGLVSSQARSLWDLLSGSQEDAIERQFKFAHGATIACQSWPESLPIVGHMVGAMYCCGGNRRKGTRVAQKASRTCAVLCSGAAISMFVSSTAAPATMAVRGASAMAGLTVGVAVDMLISDVSIPRSLTPGQKFDAVAFRIVDTLRGLSGLDLAFVLTPDVIVMDYGGIWTHPQNVNDLMVPIWTNPQSLDDLMVVASYGKVDELMIPEALGIPYHMATPYHMASLVTTLKGNGYASQVLALKAGNQKWLTDQNNWQLSGSKDVASGPSFLYLKKQSGAGSSQQYHDLTRVAEDTAIVVVSTDSWIPGRLALDDEY